MDKYLRPERFDEDPSSKTAKEWLHWKKTFVNFLAQSELSAASKDTATKWPQIKLQLLINHISPKVYAHVSEYETYDSVIAALDKLYVKPINIIYARHLLATRKQQAGETIDKYMQSLKQLAKDCDFTSVDAETNKNDTIRGAFIAGMASAKARSRLLESLSLTLDQTYNTALSMEMAETNSQTFINPIINAVPLASAHLHQRNNDTAPGTVTTTAATITNVANSSSTRKCWYCGGSLHARWKCPAKDTVCKSCKKKGHFSKECRSKPNTSASITSPEECEHCSAIIAATPASLRKAMIPAVIKGIKAQALVDTGSSISFINEDFANLCRLKRSPCTQTVSMASLSHTSQVSGSTCQNVHLGDHCYEKINLLIVKNLCADLIIGHDVLALHSTLEFAFGGPKDAFKVCSVAEASVPAVPLFANVSLDCKPIAIRSRRHSPEDQAFIADEVKKLLEDGIIEESHSPWRAQVLVTKNANHKKRLVIDYSQTVNRYTQLDAYPLPNMEEMVTNVSKYAVFSTIDLQTAYHQVPILSHEKPFTAFEACGNLYQFRRIPFGVTNGVASFQRTVDWLIRKENLSGAYAYLDDITVCGNTQQEHDINLERFLRAADKYGLTLNKTKSKFSQRIINLLGYTIQDHVIKPDSDRLQPFLRMPPPNDPASHRRALGMFAHYSKWIPNFSERIRILAHSDSFPLSEEAKDCFEGLKSTIAKSSVHAIDDNMPFTVETDASEHTIAATLTQDSRPVAFFSRTLNHSELNHSAVEKEAYAIVESLKKWRHFLIGKHFTLITDQRSVSFMLNAKHASKIKNEKIQRWRLELAPYNYDIVYRPGKDNKAADALSRICACTTNSSSKLQSLHASLCHPGVARMYHWLKSKNLPYSIDEVRTMTRDCRLCAEVKPRYFNNPSPTPKLIKATSALERLSVDFKGPLPSKSNNKYILTVIDEYSRFPFAFPCSDMSAKTVIKHLNSLFMIFGMPAYIHSDRGTQFLSTDLRDYLHSKGIATSNTTAYNPQCNGQVEKLNSTVWKAVQLACGTHNAPIEHWEQYLSVALHSIRSLLCTATNCTPHERMFMHTRRSPNGNTIPTWLTSSGQVLMKRFDRKNKYQPLVEEVELIQSNPDYSFVRLQDGRETTVSNRHLAPIGENTGERLEELKTGTMIEEEYMTPPSSPIRAEETTNSAPSSPPVQSQTTNCHSPGSPQPFPSPAQALDTTQRIPSSSTTPPRVETSPPVLRRSSRTRKPPRHLQDYSVGE